MLQRQKRWLPLACSSVAELLEWIEDFPCQPSRMYQIQGLQHCIVEADSAAKATGACDGNHTAALRYPVHGMEP